MACGVIGQHPSMEFTPIPSTDPDQTPVRKPRRIRDSCNACAEGKVKCSRNRPSCMRCVMQGKTCEYSISRRMGRQPTRVQLQSGASTRDPSKSRRGSSTPFDDCMKLSRNASLLSNIHNMDLNNSGTYSSGIGAARLMATPSKVADSMAYMELDTDMNDLASNSWSDLPCTSDFYSLYQAEEVFKDFTPQSVEVSDFDALFEQANNAPVWSLTNTSQHGFLTYTDTKASTRSGSNDSLDSEFLTSIKSNASSTDLRNTAPTTPMTNSSHNLQESPTLFTASTSREASSRHRRQYGDCLELAQSVIASLQAPRTPCSASGSKLKNPDLTLDQVLQRCEDGMETLSTVIRCPCFKNNTELPIVSGLAFNRILSWYNAVARASDCSAGYSRASFEQASFVAPDTTSKLWTSQVDTPSCYYNDSLYQQLYPHSRPQNLRTPGCLFTRNLASSPTPDQIVMTPIKIGAYQLDEQSGAGFRNHFLATQLHKVGKILAAWSDASVESAASVEAIMVYPPGLARGKYRGSQGASPSALVAGMERQMDAGLKERLEALMIKLRAA